jgi:hypothetical protein
MALSMEEQRILAGIEQELARSEPALAARLASFGHPGRAALLRSARSPRVLVVASLAALLLLTVLPVVVYALVSLRGVPRGGPAGHPAVSAQHHAVPPQPIMSAPR